MRISDWSSDVCSSDLQGFRRPVDPYRQGQRLHAGGRGVNRQVPVRSVRWWRSVTVRLTLVSTVLATAMVGVVFGFLYWRAVGVVESQAADTVASRSEERRVGKECVSTGRSWGSPDH